MSKLLAALVAAGLAAAALTHHPGLLAWQLRGYLARLEATTGLGIDFAEVAWDGHAWVLAGATVRGPGTEVRAPHLVLQLDHPWTWSAGVDRLPRVEWRDATGRVGDPPRVRVDRYRLGFREVAVGSAAFALLDLQGESYDGGSPLASGLRGGSIGWRLRDALPGKSNVRLWRADEGWRLWAQRLPPEVFRPWLPENLASARSPMLDLDLTVAVPPEAGGPWTFTGSLELDFPPEDIPVATEGEKRLGFVKAALSFGTTAVIAYQDHQRRFGEVELALAGAVPEVGLAGLPAAVAAAARAAAEAMLVSDSWDEARLRAILRPASSAPVEAAPPGAPPAR